MTVNIRNRVINMMARIVGRAVLRLLPWTFAAVASLAQAGAYLYTPPPGWLRTGEGGVVGYYTPPGEPPASAASLLALLPVNAAQKDFSAQLAAERAHFERSLGLSDPQSTTVQRGHSENGEYAAYSASYAASDGGVRYVILMALADKGAFGMLAFVATRNEAYNRWAKSATASFKGLRLSDDAVRIAAGPAASSVTPPREDASVSSAHARSGGKAPAADAKVDSVWMAFKMLGNVSLTTSWVPFRNRFSTVTDWITFFRDGEVMTTLPRGGLDGFDRSASHRDPNQRDSWGVLHGKEIVIPGVTDPYKIERISADQIKIDGDPYYRCKPVDGLRLDGAWTSLANPKDPDLDRWPVGHRPVFRFGADGRFVDEGVFATFPHTYGGPPGVDAPGVDAPGAGRYEIRAYTLTLRFDDGRIKRLALTGMLGGDPATQNDILYLDRNRFNKR